MYCPADCDGLGQYPVTAYIAPAETGGQSMSDLCADTFFRLTHPEECAGPAPAPAPEPEPVYVVPVPTEPVAAPTPQPAIVADLELDDVIPGIAGDVELEPTIIEVGGGGWGGGSTDVSVQPAAVIIESEERGFGLVEALMGAGLAWVLASSYRARRKR